MDNVDNHSMDQPLVSQLHMLSWIINDNRVYDISSLRHPKGQYILKGISGHDITRELLGLRSWRFENRERKYVKYAKHLHAKKTFRLLRKYCIGELTPSELLYDGSACVLGQK